LQLHPDSASVESCVVFMPGNNRQRVARPFGRRFVNSEVTHAFTTGRLQYSAGNKPGYMWPLQAARFLRVPGLFIPEHQIGFSEDPAAFTNGKTSVGEHSTGAVHQRPFPIAALCFEATPQPLRALLRRISFSARCTLRIALAGSISRLPPPTVFLMLRSKTAQNQAQLALTTTAESAQKHEFARAARRPRKKGLSR
jgi:hypothetical protein